MSAGDRRANCYGAILCLAALFGARSAEAAEASTSPSLKAGIVPREPGARLRNEFFHYNGGISRTAIGGRLSIDLHGWFVTGLPAVTIVSPVNILGRIGAFSLAIPMVGLVVTAGVESAHGSRLRQNRRLALQVT